jgi:hypothetical protein
MGSLRAVVALHLLLFALRRKIAPQKTGNAVRKKEGKKDDGGDF